MTTATASGGTCVAITYPSYLELTLLTLACCIILSLFVAAEAALLLRHWRAAREDARWARLPYPADQDAYQDQEADR